MQSLKISSALALTLVLWASVFVAIRIGLTAYSPGALALLRFLVASLCMMIIYFFLPHKKIMSWTIRGQLLLIGVAAIGIYNTCLNYGELTVSASVASFIIGLIPVATIIFSAIFLKERLHPFVWMGVIISFIGLGLMLVGESECTAIDSGVLIILISSLMGGMYNVSQKSFLRQFHPIAVTAWVMWGGTLMLLWFANDLWQELPEASLEATYAAIYMGIFPAATAYVTWCYVLTYWSASKASFFYILYLFCRHY